MERKRSVTIEDLRREDNDIGKSWNKLKRKVYEEAKFSNRDELTLLTEKVVGGFVNAVEGRKEEKPKSLLIKQSSKTKSRQEERQRDRDHQREERNPRKEETPNIKKKKNGGDHGREGTKTLGKQLKKIKRVDLADDNDSTPLPDFRREVLDANSITQGQGSDVFLVKKKELFGTDGAKCVKASSQTATPVTVNITTPKE